MFDTDDQFVQPAPLDQRVGRLYAVLTDGSYRYDTERELQDQLEERLRRAGLRYRREAKLHHDAGTPDFLVGPRPYLALEVKIKGSRNEVLRQVDRYLGSDQVGACVLATTRASHLDLPPAMREKRLRVAWLSAGGAIGGTGEIEEAEPIPTVGQIVRTSEGWEVTLEAHAMGRFKRVFPRVTRKHYGTVPLDDRRSTCRDLIWFMDRYPLQGSELDLQHLKVQAERYDRQRARVGAVVNGVFTPRSFEMAIPPRQYQRVAAEAALQAGGLLCGDDLGLGKTVTAITMLTDPSTRPALVVCPTHLPHQWQDEFTKFAPQLRTHVITKGSPYDVTRPKGARKRNGDRFHIPPEGTDRPFPDVLICSWSKLAGWAETLAVLVKSVVWDEVQELRKGGKTAKGQAAYYLAQAVAYRLGLSATPVYNYADEIWAVMEAIMPGAMGTRAEFVQEWCSAQGMDNSRVRDPRALGSWLRSEGLMIRRTRADVGRELPPLHNVPVLIEADLAGLERAKREVADLARMILGENTKPLERGRASMELSWKMRQATGIAKAPYVAAFVIGLFADGAPSVVLAGWHREVYTIWMDLLKAFDPVLYTGSESPAGKRRAKDRFCSGESRVLIMSLRSGSGLDGLQDIGCRDVVYGELDWSPKVHSQLSGRVHRDGQPDPVTAWFLHTANGSDPIVMDVLGIKQAQSAGILDPLNTNPEAKADASRGRALARRLLGMKDEK